MGKTNFLKKYFSLFIGILTSTSLFASAPDTLWTRTYGGTNWNSGLSVQQTQDDGFIVAGWTNSFGTGYQDVYLLKTNSSRDTLWTKTFGGIDYDIGYSVQQTSDGGFIITGFTASFGTDSEDVYLIKTDSLGDTLWTKTYGGTSADYGHSVQQTQDGGFIIAGYTKSFGAGAEDVYLIKTDSLGDTMWTKTFGGAKDDRSYSVQQTLGGGFIITGYTNSFGTGSNDFYLIKTDSSGDTMWTKTFGGTSYDIGYSVQQTKDSGFIIAGGTYSFGIGIPNYANVYLIRTNSSGDTLWTKTFGGISHDWGASVQQTQDGGFIITGETNSFGAGNYDVYLIRTDSSGDTMWTKTFGGAALDMGASVQQAQDGGFIITGKTQSFVASSIEDVYLIRLGKETGVEEKLNIKNPSTTLRTSQNPFINSTTIKYFVSATSKVSLKIYDILGRTAKTLVDGEKEAGSYTINLNAKELKAGIYFVRLTTICHSERSEESNMIKVTKKITIIR